MDIKKSLEIPSHSLNYFMYGWKKWIVIVHNAIYSITMVVCWYLPHMLLLVNCKCYKCCRTVTVHHVSQSFTADFTCNRAFQSSAVSINSHIAVVLYVFEIVWQGILLIFHFPLSAYKILMHTIAFKLQTFDKMICKTQFCKMFCAVDL